MQEKNVTNAPPQDLMVNNSDAIQQARVQQELSNQRQIQLAQAINLNFMDNDFSKKLKNSDLGNDSENRPLQVTGYKVGLQNDKGIVTDASIQFSNNESITLKHSIKETENGNVSVLSLTSSTDKPVTPQMAAATIKAMLPVNNQPLAITLVTTGNKEKDEAVKKAFTDAGFKKEDIKQISKDEMEKQFKTASTPSGPRH